MAIDLLSALKELFESDPDAVGSVGGRWYIDEAATSQEYPYVTITQTSGAIGLRTSTSNVDNVRIRLRVWSDNDYTSAVAAANILETLFLAQNSLTWDGGWSTILERVDRKTSKPVGRAPAAGGPVRVIDITFLTHVRREVHA